MKKIWNKENVLLLTKLFDEGKTNKEIGLIFNKKPDTIGVKLKRLGLIRNKKNNYRENIVCNCCSKTFVALISENRKYCSSTCAAKVNNQNVSRRKTITKKCIECGDLISPNNKDFCSRKCRTINKEKHYFINIEKGVYVFNTKQTEEKWVKKYLIKKHGEKCIKCGWCEKHLITNNIPIQMNHIDGNSDNNKLNNVELLCPNCHSLTENYGSLNLGGGRSERKIKRAITLKKQKEKQMSAWSSG